MTPILIFKKGNPVFAVGLKNSHLNLLLNEFFFGFHEELWEILEELQIRLP